MTDLEFIIIVSALWGLAFGWVSEHVGRKQKQVHWHGGEMTRQVLRDFDRFRAFHRTRKSVQSSQAEWKG